MRNISPVLVNMPSELADKMTAIGKNNQVSRTRVIIEACLNFLPKEVIPTPVAEPRKSNWFHHTFVDSSGTGIL